MVMLKEALLCPVLSPSMQLSVRQGPLRTQASSASLHVRIDWDPTSAGDGTRRWLGRTKDDVRDFGTKLCSMMMFCVQYQQVLEDFGDVLEVSA